jgi:hypothetical protein
MKQLTDDEINAILETRNAKTKRLREEALKHILDEAMQQMTSQHDRCEDHAANEASELALAEKIIAAYVDFFDEASLAELREVLQHCAIDPRHVMTIAKRLLTGRP